MCGGLAEELPAASGTPPPHPPAVRNSVNFVTVNEIPDPPVLTQYLLWECCSKILCNLIFPGSVISEALENRS